MKRRSLLQAGLGLLAAPAIAQTPRVLRVIPEADLASLDPVWTTATVTRDHAFMVFDTLYGFDENYSVQPQMVEGHTVEDGRIWTIKLRSGVRFHNGEPVLARDVVPSVQRWASRASFGQTMMAVTDDFEAVDDRTIRLRMKNRFPVSRALADSALIMPAHLAATDSSKAITEMIGSGPFRFLADERIAGAHAAYAKFEGYVPRSEGVASQTAGPKIAYVDRVEWHVIPDPGTAAAAMMAGEMDWWEASPDFLAQLRRSTQVRLGMIDLLCGIRIMRFNHLQPPFDNPAIRRVLLGVIDQADVMAAFAGEERDLWRDHVGVFTPGTPMASDVGMEVLTGPRDYAKARGALAAAGYGGEKVVILNPADQPQVSSNTLVGADMLTKAGMNVDVQTMDWGTLLQRRAKTDSSVQGGWNIVFTGLSGSGTMDPSSHIGLRGNGRQAWAGWPTSPRIEELRDAWFGAPDVAAQKAICIEIQKQFWQDVPYIPLGQTFGVNAFNRRVTNEAKGFPLFYGLKVA
jgi:peptide/nickel transport system substrate-binding protein